jgi:hypothetical protein
LYRSTCEPVAGCSRVDTTNVENISPEDERDVGDVNFDGVRSPHSGDLLDGDFGMKSVQQPSNYEPYALSLEEMMIQDHGSLQPVGEPPIPSTGIANVHHLSPAPAHRNPGQLYYNGPPRPQFERAAQSPLSPVLPRLNSHPFASIKPNEGSKRWRHATAKNPENSCIGEHVIDDD